MKFVTACYKYFGKLDGQSTGEFADEVKKLTEKDRADLKPELERELRVEIED